jgi:hypothetical protein
MIDELKGVFCGKLNILSPRSTSSSKEVVNTFIGNALLKL